MLPSSAFVPKINAHTLLYDDLIPNIENDRVTTVQKDQIPPIRPIEPLISVQLLFTVATGIPIPETDSFDRNGISDRKIRVSLFDKRSESFFGNSVFVDCKWTESEPDKWRFGEFSESGLNPIIFRTHDPDLVEHDGIDIIFEFIIDCIFGDSPKPIEMNCGWAAVPLKDFREKKTRPKSLKLEIKGGCPGQESSVEQ